MVPNKSGVIMTVTALHSRGRAFPWWEATRRLAGVGWRQGSEKARMPARRRGGHPGERLAILMRVMDGNLGRCSDPRT
jgi:hypothetical protein